MLMSKAGTLRRSLWCASCPAGLSAHSRLDTENARAVARLCHNHLCSVPSGTGLRELPIEPAGDTLAASAGTLLYNELG